MPKGEAGLSAIARQRSLRNGPTPPSQPSDSSIVPVKRRIEHVISDSTTSSEHEDEYSRVKSPISKQVVNRNQFHSLVESSAVSFTPDRLIEQVNTRSLKIGLGQSEKCAVIGVFTIWVKQGRITLYGAILSASVNIYRVYVPTTHNIPLIEALSEYAEFQIESLDNGIRDVPWIGGSTIWSAPKPATSSDMTFSVLGVSFEIDSKFAKRLRYIREEHWRPVLSRLSNQAKPGKKSAPSATKRILVCGQQPSQSSSFACYILNQILTIGNSSNTLQYSHGATFLDLNSDFPEFTAPGTVALLQIRQPAFGPSFTHMVRGKSSANRILKMHLANEDNRTLTNFSMIDLLDHKAKHRSEIAKCPLVICVPSWLEALDYEAIKEVWTKMELTDIVYLDSDSSRGIPEHWKRLADKDQVVIHHCTDIGQHELKSTRQHEMHLQSCFHLLHDGTEHRIWEEIPLLGGAAACLSSDYHGHRALFRACYIIDNEVSLSDTISALEECVCGIVKVRSDYFAYLADRCGLHATQETIARLMQMPEASMPFDLDKSECLGLALIKKVDVNHGLLHFFSTMPMDELIEERSQDGYELILVVPRCENTGRRSLDWMYREMDVFTKSAEEVDENISDEEADQQG